MALLAEQIIVEAGIAPSFVAAAGGGDSFANDGDVLLYVKNGGGGSITVTVTAQAVSLTLPSRGAMTKSNGGGSVGAGAERVFGPFPKASFNNASGEVAVTYSGVTSVTVAAMRLKQPT